MNDYRTDTDLADDDLLVAHPSAPASTDESAEKRDRGLIIARVIHHIGGGIRWSYNRNLAWSLAIALGLHVLLVGLYSLSLIGDDEYVPPVVRPLQPLTLTDTNFIAIDMRQVEITNPGGGGGDPMLDEPVGKSKAGDRDAQPKYVPEKPKTSEKPKVFEPKAPTKVKPVDKPKDERPVATTDRDTAKGPSSGIGHKGHHAEGKGVKDAGGSGGTGVGRGVGIGVGNGEGLGGRGWVRRPSSKAPSDLSATGTVRLAFTVMPNGEITGITPIKKASTELTNLAVARLRAAKVKPLPDDAPQVPQKSAITFDFSLK